MHNKEEVNCLSTLTSAKHTLMEWIKSEIDCGKEVVACNIDSFGKLVDAAKDLAEAEEKCRKAEYYRTVVEAMDNYDENDRAGYDNWRYANGRFAPTGHGSRRGFTEPDLSSNIRIHDPHFAENMRMGYPMDDYMSDRGRTYDAYQDAKRHYTASKNPEDMKVMNARLGENISDVISQLMEMSEDASPEMQKKLKTDINMVLDNLNKMAY